MAFVIIVKLAFIYDAILQSFSVAICCNHAASARVFVRAAPSKLYNSSRSIFTSILQSLQCPPHLPRARFKGQERAQTPFSRTALRVRARQTAKRFVCVCVCAKLERGAASGLLFAQHINCYLNIPGMYKKHVIQMILFYATQIR